MAKFFIGQRVRIIRTVSEVPVGTEGTIDKLKFWPKGTVNKWGIPLIEDVDCGVDFLGYGRRCCHTQRLEPILPEGHKPYKYSFHEMMDNLKEQQYVNS